MKWDTPERDSELGQRKNTPPPDLLPYPTTLVERNKLKLKKSKPIRWASLNKTEPSTQTLKSMILQRSSYKVPVLLNPKETVTLIMIITGIMIIIMMIEIMINNVTIMKK